MEVFWQMEIDDEQRHREGENGVGQGIEPGFRNKLLGLSHHSPWSSPTANVLPPSRWAAMRQRKEIARAHTSKRELDCNVQSISDFIEAVCRKRLQNVKRGLGQNQCPKNSAKNYMSGKIGTNWTE